MRRVLARLYNGFLTPGNDLATGTFRVTVTHPMEVVADSIRIGESTRPSWVEQEFQMPLVRPLAV